MTRYELLSLVLSGIALAGSIVGMLISAVSANKVHETERRLSQRQTVIDLWPHISNLDLPAANDPAPRAVVNGVNALELVAVCWEAEAVDRDVIRRVFAEPFLRMHAAIAAVTVPLTNGRTGPEMLQAAPSIGALYDTLTRERQATGKVGKL
jgi:hypothetical protein